MFALDACDAWLICLLSLSSFRALCNFRLDCSSGRRGSSASAPPYLLWYDWRAAEDGSGGMTRSSASASS